MQTNEVYQLIEQTEHEFWENKKAANHTITIMDSKAIGRFICEVALDRDKVIMQSVSIMTKAKKGEKMIYRIWHGWTTPENADPYENLLKKEIFPAIASKNVSGYRGIQLLRRPSGNEVEFITIMQFDSLKAVKQFAGEDYEKSYVPDMAKQVLSRHDHRSQHYEMRESIMY